MAHKKDSAGGGGSLLIRRGKKLKSSEALNRAQAARDAKRRVQHIAKLLDEDLFGIAHFEVKALEEDIKRYLDATRRTK